MNFRNMTDKQLITYYQNRLEVLIKNQDAPDAIYEVKDIIKELKENIKLDEEIDHIHTLIDPDMY